MIDTQKVETALVMASDTFDPSNPNNTPLLHQKYSKHTHTWHPPTDLYETDLNYIVRVEVAGMDKEEFCVSLENERLDVSGSRPDIDLNRGYHQIEIPYGNFHTSVLLPSPVEGSLVKAEYHDGFLLVTLPKVIPTIIVIKEE